MNILYCSFIITSKYFVLGDENSTLSSSFGNEHLLVLDTSNSSSTNDDILKLINQASDNITRIVFEEYELWFWISMPVLVFVLLFNLVLIGLVLLK